MGRLDRREERKILCTVRCVPVIGVQMIPDRFPYARGVMHDGRRVQQRLLEVAHTNGVGQRCLSVLRVLNDVKQGADDEVLDRSEWIYA